MCYVEKFVTTKKFVTSKKFRFLKDYLFLTFFVPKGFVAPNNIHSYKIVIFCSLKEMHDESQKSKIYLCG